MNKNRVKLNRWWGDNDARYLYFPVVTRNYRYKYYQPYLRFESDVFVCVVASLARIFTLVHTPLIYNNITNFILLTIFKGVCY